VQVSTSPRCRHTALIALIERSCVRTTSSGSPATLAARKSPGLAICSSRPTQTQERPNTASRSNSKNSGEV
jgi:hypothetical protein